MERLGNDPLRVVIIAGEASGDRLGAALMRSLAAEAGTVHFSGVGGERMCAAGLEPWFEAGALSVMGFTGVLPHLPKMIRLLRATADRVVALNPHALITVDSPGFTLRLARRVRHRACHIPIIHYVAPSVWAWGPWRTRRLVGVVDRLLALLPFEPEYFSSAGISCDFVGHPAVEGPKATEMEVEALRAEAGASRAPLLLLAPGSRSVEIRQMLPVFAETVRQVRRRIPAVRVVLPLASIVEDEVRRAARVIEPAPLLIAPGDEKRRRAAFMAADAALVTSGSVVLEAAYGGTPMVSAYRTNRTDAAVLRLLARVDTANLVNLVAGERVVPEFLQEHCVPEAMAFVLDRLLRDPGHGCRQRQAFARVLDELGAGWRHPPSRVAAKIIVEVLAAGSQRSSMST